MTPLLRDTLYDAALHLLVPTALAHLWWRGRRQPAYRQHIAERFGRYATPPLTPRLWVHAVSVGETRAAQPLIRALQSTYPGQRILMTHTTPTGRETGEQLFGTSLDRLYAPYDLKRAVSRFIRHARPGLGLLMETELWPNLVRSVVHAGAPVFLPPGGASGSPYSTLFARPVVPIEQASTLGTVGDVVLADFSQYFLGEKGPMQSAVSVHVRFLYDEWVVRFILRCDGVPAWHNKLTPYKGSATQSPFIGLATRS